ncbi:uncharacterized protein LOC103861265 [Brassica rapa]|uniref:uncharacterized protein LOC117126143 n=1 Tax=Brassica campestris TaxID=3711 RepID=UPI0004F1779D|nr:uncharacterized protein LOC117126143 [Brassica rapa]XP_033143296.1 uncharacterized protein LOC103861265 [Brassica rapa]XP_048608061.1 uncharacterized protein LOC125584087 [Brassica napus]
MANMEKLQFPALDITGTNYISWVTNVELHLESLGLSETVKEINTSTPQEKAKSVIFLRRHLDESIIYDYANMRDPKELWKSLKDRFDHQKDITLPLARDEWQSLRFQDFDKVMNYNSAVLGIVAKLRYCGETITESQMLEKTYTTFHKSHITLQQQYRLRGYTKFSELIVALLIAEKNNELLIKNHMTRPTGSKPFPEANALDAKKPVKENKAYWGRGRGRQNYRGRGRKYNPQDRKSFQWVRSEQTPKGKEHQGNTSQKREEACFRCGTKGHWSRLCRTPAHLCALYKESVKGKEKEVNFAEHSEGTTHLDASDFVNDFEETAITEA